MCHETRCTPLDPSLDGLMGILSSPDATVMVSRLVTGNVIDTWETVPAEDTDLPEKLLAWRDTAVQQALDGTDA